MTTIGKIVSPAFGTAFQKVVSTPFAGKRGLDLMKVKRHVVQAVEDYNSLRKTLVESYAKLDEEGKIVRPTPDSVALRDGIQEELTEGLKSIESQPFSWLPDGKFSPLSWEEMETVIKKSEITPDDLEALVGLYEEPKGV